MSDLVLTINEFDRLYRSVYMHAHGKQWVCTVCGAWDREIHLIKHSEECRPFTMYQYRVAP